MIRTFCQRKGVQAADACRAWLAVRARGGTRFLVPEIADYELRCELVRLGHVGAVARLDDFNSAAPGCFMPITKTAMRRAADLWAQARHRGLPTSDPKELDGDVILVAQAMTAGLVLADVAIATTNPVHIRRFIEADLWANL